jgi:hypothetical protein
VATLLGAAPAASYADAFACARTLTDAAGGAPPRPSTVVRPLARARALASGGGWLSARALQGTGRLSRHPLGSWTGPDTWVLRLGASLAMARAAGLAVEPLVSAIGQAAEWSAGWFVLRDRGLAREVTELDWLANVSVVDGVRALALDTLFADALARAALDPLALNSARGDDDVWNLVTARAQEDSEVAMLLYWVDPDIRFAAVDHTARGFLVERSIPMLDPFVTHGGTVQPLSLVCAAQAETVAAAAATPTHLRVAIQP